MFNEETYNEFPYYRSTVNDSHCPHCQNPVDNTNVFQMGRYWHAPCWHDFTVEQEHYYYYAKSGPDYSEEIKPLPPKPLKQRLAEIFDDLLSSIRW